MSKVQATSGLDGTGPRPYQERLGLPRNVSRPSTVPSSDQARPEAAGSAQPSYGGRVVVVVSATVVSDAAVSDALVSDALVSDALVSDPSGPDVVVAASDSLVVVWAWLSDAVGSLAELA